MHGECVIHNVLIQEISYSGIGFAWSGITTGEDCINNFSSHFWIVVTYNK